MGRGIQHHRQLESQKDVISERLEEEEKSGIKGRTDGEKEVIEQFRLDEEESVSDREELKVSKHVSDGGPSSHRSQPRKSFDPNESMARSSVYKLPLPNK
jgi:hypothetical protein